MDQHDKIQDKEIDKVMKKSYIEYAMSVIVSRALPDVRDGLKPVHRRILYSMNELNLEPNKPYKKSARIVGDTMGKYHPHGNTAIYDAMVRMAQDFSMRYMLVDGHGNFGSIDGDGAAADRYTEARLSKICMHMLLDIEKNTVDFADNYTGEFKEPTVLPSRIPNLLINGSSGIAVGMATNIPPHNIIEVLDAVIKIIDNNINNIETSIDDIMDIITGPDFPTGGLILGTQGIKQAYRTGRGRVVMRANAVIEEKNGRNIIVIDELPYQVNKSKLLIKIAELVKEKKVEGISDLREESDRKGLRIVVEIKKDANPNVVLNNLYKYSQLQETFGVNMLALVDSEPKTLNIKQMLDYYLLHQEDVITRRTNFELNKAKKREHLLEGYVIVLDHIDEAIKIIRASTDTATAKQNLQSKFSFSNEQLTAIVEMPLRSLTNLEQDKIIKEMQDIKTLIDRLNNILNNKDVLYTLIKDELLIVKNKFSDQRRSKIVFDPGQLEDEDLINDEPNVVTLTTLNYIKRLPLSTYKSQHRGGKGVIGMQTKDEDIVSNLFITNVHNKIMFFTNKGRVYIIKTYEIPEVSRTARGMAIINLLNLNPDETIAACFPISRNIDTEDKCLVMITKKGIIKKTKLKEYANIRTNGIIALKFKEDDELVKVLLAESNSEILIATKFGMGIRFNENEIRPLSRSATGVRGIRLKEDDCVIGAGVANEYSKVLFVAENGYGKCTKFDAFRLQFRGGKGTKTYKVTSKTGNVISLCFVNDNEEIIIINSEGIVIRLKVCDISTVGRNTSGVKLVSLKNDSKVITVAKITENHLEDEFMDTEKIEEEVLLEEQILEEEIQEEIQEQIIEKDLE